MGLFNKSNSSSDDSSEMMTFCPRCQAQANYYSNYYFKKRGFYDRQEGSDRAGENAGGCNATSGSADAAGIDQDLESSGHLMEPKNLAVAIKPLFPEMFESMPKFKKARMRRMAKSDSGLERIEEKLPEIMPELMENVMPRISELAAGGNSGESEGARSQRPEPMSKTPKSLSPGYVSKVVPYAVPLFMGFLRDRYHEDEENQQYQPNCCSPEVRRWRSM
ncbi:MAG: hypothetical protein ACOYIK_00430 [Coriobacteriales bacterium]|jgi:hypothetical protein